MQAVDRHRKMVGKDDAQDKLIKYMYETKVGRAITSFLIKPRLSEACKTILDMRGSRLLIPLFIKANNIDMSLYEKSTYKDYLSFNDFFTRKIKPQNRLIDMNKTSLISPCDARLSMYFIDEKSSFLIKNTRYTLKELLRDGELAKKYEGGYIGIFRLCVDDYHRFHFIDDGIKSHERHINGVFHTVNPIANDVYPIYKENTREYCVHRTENFGDVIVMEVGALLVGRIVNNMEKCRTKKGAEKGYFEYGGSTVVLIFKKNAIIPDEDILVNTVAGYETKVNMGEKIGTSVYIR